MPTQKIYCSACDRDVQVVTPNHNALETLEGAVCLDIGPRCTGVMCPICARAPATMRAETGAHFKES